jgi:hypothetical protein
VINTVVYQSSIVLKSKQEHQESERKQPMTPNNARVNQGKKRNKLGVSPRGVFIYPRLTTPDTKFDQDGIYSLKLGVSDEKEAKKLIDEIDAVIEGQVQETSLATGGRGRIKRADPPYVQSEDDPGTTIFNFKMKALVQRNDGTTFTQKPVLKGPDPKVDLPETTAIGSGSEGKVAYSIVPFYTKMIGAGASLRLRAVQVLKLVEPSYSYGFDMEEPGEGFSEASSTPPDDDASDSIEDEDNEAEAEAEEGEEEGSEEDGAAF